MSGPGAALRELGEGTAWETETLGCETVWRVPGKARRPCGWSGGWGGGEWAGRMLGWRGSQGLGNEFLYLFWERLFFIL